MENKKISLQELADAISAQSGSTKKFTDSFLRELVVVIQEYLEKDGMVKVKGLGTFKLLWIEARKSINVATKETIILPAHYKLSFTPEENVKQEINAHVSSFGGAEVLENSENEAESIEDESGYNETSEVVINEIEVEEPEEPVQEVPSVDETPTENEEVAVPSPEVESEDKIVEPKTDDDDEDIVVPNTGAFTSEGSSAEITNDFLVITVIVGVVVATGVLMKKEKRE